MILLYLQHFLNISVSRAFRTTLRFQIPHERMKIRGPRVTVPGEWHREANRSYEKTECRNSSKSPQFGTTNARRAEVFVQCPYNYRREVNNSLSTLDFSIFVRSIRSPTPRNSFPFFRARALDGGNSAITPSEWIVNVSSRFSLSPAPVRPGNVDWRRFAHQFGIVAPHCSFPPVHPSRRGSFPIFFIYRRPIRKRWPPAGCITRNYISRGITVCPLWLMRTDSEQGYYWLSRDTLEKYVPQTPLRAVFTVVPGRSDTVMQKPRKPVRDAEWNL